MQILSSNREINLTELFRLNNGKVELKKENLNELLESFKITARGEIEVQVAKALRTFIDSFNELQKLTGMQLLYHKENLLKIEAHTAVVNTYFYKELAKQATNKNK